MTTPEEFWKMEEKERSRIYMEMMPWEQEEMFAWDPKVETAEERHERLLGLLKSVCNSLEEIIDNLNEDGESDKIRNS